MVTIQNDYTTVTFKTPLLIGEWTRNAEGQERSVTCPSACKPVLSDAETFDSLEFAHAVDLKA